MWCAAPEPEPREDGTDQYEQLCEALIFEGTHSNGKDRSPYYILELFKVERDSAVSGIKTKKQHVIDQLSQTKADAYATMTLEGTTEEVHHQLQNRVRRCENIITLLKQPKSEQQKLLEKEPAPQRKEMWVDL